MNLAQALHVAGADHQDVEVVVAGGHVLILLLTNFAGSSFFPCWGVPSFRKEVPGFFLSALVIGPEFQRRTHGRSAKKGGIVSITASQW
jgi:hypothetical protein